jgi:hypothetical protein
MPDELEICLAALFLNKGKDVLTPKEFTMYASLDLRWMQVKDAEALMSMLLEKGLISNTGGYIRPAIDTSSVIVPVAYRPSDKLIKTLSGYKPKQQAKKESPPDLLSRLIQEALRSGVEKGAFISECNRISKKADVDIEVAALLILREKGVDVVPFINDARSSVGDR